MDFGKNRCSSGIQYRMKNTLLLLPALLCCALASAQRDGMAVMLDDAIRAENGWVTVRLLMPDSYAAHRSAALELAAENAAILHILEDGDILTVEIQERSADRNAWRKILATLGISVIEVDTGEQYGIDEMAVEDFLTHYNVD